MFFYLGAGKRNSLLNHYKGSFTMKWGYQDTTNSTEGFYGFCCCHRVDVTRQSCNNVTAPRHSVIHHRNAMCYSMSNYSLPAGLFP